MGKKGTVVLISLLAVLCVFLSAAVFCLVNRLNAYPEGTILYENSSGSKTCTIVKYELENNFTLLLTYSDQTLVQIAVGNSETNVVGETYSEEAGGYHKSN